MDGKQKRIEGNSIVDAAVAVRSIEQSDLILMTHRCVKMDYQRH